MMMQSKFKWLMVSILVVSILVFYATRDVIPDKLILSTGQPGGFYHQVGTELKHAWEKQTQQQLELLTSSGSQENFTALKESKADFALIQGGVVDLDGLNIIAPLSTDLIHVIVRKESSIRAISDLKGKSILIGMSGSGMAASALKMLHFHGLDEVNTNLKNAYFTGLDGNQNMDAAIVTAGILNSDLVELLESGNYRIIPIEYAQAFCEKNAFFSPTVIHKGLYRMGDSLLSHDIPTVATTALLVGREELSHEVVDQILLASFEKASYVQSPVMLNIEEVRQQQDLKLHPRAMHYFHPADQIGYMADVMESLAALKELAVAFVAGLYLLWDRWRRQHEKEIAARLSEDKEKLDALLAQTVEIERKYSETNTLESLQGMLRRIMQIKIQALEELTHESLRGDRVFLIFMTQCSSLINSLEAKINRLNP
ncbi:MAG: TAXI family TRAP transporter solute-binding subunit [Verrucomicrobiae bacterium]|nr:TAXI family TRAP transporter solute-binding subunit [Verrucomicrobiae bacterium]